MQLPNKLFSYSESILAKFPLFLRILEAKPMRVQALYNTVKNDLPDINDFFEILDALYALNKIDFDDINGVLYYVT